MNAPIRPAILAPTHFAGLWDVQEHMARELGGDPADYFHGKPNTLAAAVKLGIREQFERAVAAMKDLDPVITSSVRNAERKAQPTARAEAPKADCTALDGVAIVRADSVKPEPIAWLWDGFLAAGKVHIMAGAPGTGKTTLALGLLAALTCGGRWPDGSRAAAGAGLIWTGEDGIADTIVPRLIAAGADLGRVHFVGDRMTPEGVRAFDPAEDFAALEEAAAGIQGLRMVIVDPIVSAIAGDSHKSADVRRGLQPLVRFAERTGCAVLGISHFSKGTAGKDPVERVTGSIAFGALARLVLATAKVPEEDGGGRIMVRAKSNLGPDGSGFRYELRVVELQGAHAGIVTTRPEWMGAIEGEAREILASVETQGDPEERSAAGEAATVLREILEAGSVQTKEARRKLKGDGFTDKQIRRARESLRVVRTREGFGGADYWSLPAAHSCPVSAVDAHPLREGTNGHERSAEGMNGAESEVL